MKSVEIDMLTDDRVRVREITENPDSRTINEYTVPRDIYLSNLIRDKSTLTQQIADAQKVLSVINEKIAELTENK